MASSTSSHRCHHASSRFATPSSVCSAATIDLERRARPSLHAERPCEPLLQRGQLQRLGRELDRATGDLLGLRVATAQGRSLHERQPESRGGAAATGSDCTSKGGAEVREVELHAREPLARLRAPQARPRLVRETRERRPSCFCSTASRSRDPASSSEANSRIVSSIQYRGSSPSAGRLPDEALGDEREKVVEVGVAHLLDRRERAPADEDGEPAEQLLLGRLEEPVAPGDGRAERPLPLLDVARAFEDVEPGRESLEQRGWRERLRTARRRARRQAEGCRGDRRGRATSSREPVLVELRACRSCAREEQGDGVRLDERLHGVDVLAGDRKRLTARREEEQLGTAGHEGRRRGPRRRPRGARSCRAGRAPACPASAFRDRSRRARVLPPLRHRGRSRAPTRSAAPSRSGASGTHQIPSGYAPESSAAAWSASRVFPVPPGPVSVRIRTPGSEPALDEVAQLVLAAEERRRRDREVRPEEGLQRREALLAELVDPDRCGEILQPVLAEVREREVTGLEQRHRRRRDDDLAPVAARADPRCPVHVHPDVVAVHEKRLAGVDAHRARGWASARAPRRCRSHRPPRSAPRGRRRRTRLPACPPPPRRAPRGRVGRSHGARRAPRSSARLRAPRAASSSPRRR